MFLQTANVRQNRAGSGYTVAKKKKTKRDEGERKGGGDEGGGSILSRGASSGAMANRPTAFSSFRRGGTPVITTSFACY